MIFRHVPPSGAHRRKPLLPAVPARAPLGCALPSALYPLSPPASCGMAMVARGPDQRQAVLVLEPEQEKLIAAASAAQQTFEFGVTPPVFCIWVSMTPI
jgi:hypothetical protein